MLDEALKIAISEAKKSISKHRHGSVSWKSNRILHKGYNRPNGYVKDESKRVHQHSELRALGRLSEQDAYDCEVVVIRLNNAGNLTLSKPCLKCLKMMQRKGVRKVHYSDHGGEIVSLYLK